MLFLHVARSLLLPSIKALAHWLSAFGQASTPFHGCQPPKLKTKQNKKLSFPPTWSLYWLLSSKQPDPTFSYNLTDCFPQPHTPRKCTRGRQLVKQSPLALKIQLIVLVGYPGFIWLTNKLGIWSQNRTRLYLGDLSEEEMAPSPVLLPGKSHGQRSLVGHHPWGRKRTRDD